MIDEQAVQELLDKQAITEVIYRYCRAIDRLDVELFKSVYHPDAYDDHGRTKGTGHEFAEHAIEVLQPPQRTQHNITNILIELDGDIAWAESYVIAVHHFLEPAQTVLEVGARYVDRFERRAGVWRIANRVMVYEWSRELPVEREYATHALFEPARRDRTDISYRRSS
jgi:hypothetical protein